jgi:chromosome segregation ATPase
LVALRIPRALEARLRQEAAEGGRTLTDILLQALVFRWEHTHAVEELPLTREQLAQLQKEHKALEGRHTRLRADFARLQQQHKGLRSDLARVERERNKAQEELEDVKGYEWIYREMRRRLTGSKSPEGSIAPEVLMELIKLCHPDRWSQGQPATELAHEIMVRLTALARPPS